MPTINKRFLLRLVLVAAAVAGGLAGAHAVQARRIPDALRRQADRAADDGKTDLAVRYLRQYLEFAPDDVDAHVRLAELLKSRNPSPRGQVELVFLYDKILRLDPGRLAVRREALGQCLKLGRHSDAVSHAEAVLGAEPDDAAVWQQLGQAEAALNHLPEAKKAFEAAIARAPGELLPYQRLAQLLWRNQNQPAEARAVLDRMVAAAPQDPEGYYVRARFDALSAEENRSARPAALDGAVGDLRRSLELDPENAGASLLLAEILQRGRDIPAAHAVLRDAASLYPKDLRLVRSLAWLELVRGNLPAALAALEEGLKHTPDGFDLLVPLADLLVQQGDTARSAEILRRIEGRKASPTQVKYLKARLAMRQGKWAEAVGLLESLRAETFQMPGLEAQVNVLLATCFERTADPGNQEKAFKRVTTADPGNVPARAGLANFYLNQGRFDEAARELEVAVQSPYAPGGVHAQFVRLKARLLRLKGGTAADWRKLEQAAAAAAAKFGPVSSDAHVLRADVAAAQGKHADAVQLLRAEAVRRPGDVRLWAALARHAADAGGTAAGLAVVDEAQAAAGDGADIRLTRAMLYAREPGRVRPIGPLAERVEGWPETDQLRLFTGLVEVYEEVGDQAKVVAGLKAVAARRPADLAVWLRLHERAVEAGDAGAASEARAAVARLDGPSALLCDAAGGTNPDLHAKLIAAFGPAPDRWEACLALARLTPDRAEADRLTERAFVLEPTRYETAQAWLARLWTTDPARAEALTDRLHPDPRWAGGPFHRLMASVVRAVPADARSRVIAACRPLAAKDAGGTRWLADLGADDLLETAARSPAATADDWVRLALNSPAKLDAVMGQARAALPRPAFFSAAALVAEHPAGKGWTPAVTEPADRRAFAQARLAVKLSMADSAGAAAVLDQVLAEPGVTAADAGWARRNLAMLHALRGSADDRARAMDHLKAAGGPGSTPEELRATAGVLSTLARYLDGDDRRAVLKDAAAALTAAHAETKSPKDLYHLSQLNRVSGNRAESRRNLQQLLQEDPKNIYYLTTALEELTEERQFAAAKTFADWLRSLYPGEFRAVAAVARYEARAGRPEAAAALAEQYAGAADAGAGDSLARSARVAELLDELARSPGVRGTPAGRALADAAAERYAALVPSRPEAAVGAAGVVAADGRVAEAFARIEAFSKYLPASARAAAGLAAVRSGGATDRQLAAVRGWLDDALAEDPESITLRLQEADYFAARQEYAQAAAAYERVLAKDPRNVVALNNLAWTLAADPASAGRSVELVARAAQENGLSSELLDTRARARITLKQFAAAERDLAEALAQEVTPLRRFHQAVLHLAQSRPAEAAEAFAEARTLGLDPKAVHPADLPTYRVLDGSK
jgi:tetratricopeptide (TPR) repeat protein